MFTVCSSKNSLLTVLTYENISSASSQEAVSSELETLSGRVDDLLVWLRKTEAQMEEETRDDGKMKEPESRALVHLTQRLQQCKARYTYTPPLACV